MHWYREKNWRRGRCYVYAERKKKKKEGGGYGYVENVGGGGL